MTRIPAIRDLRRRVLTAALGVALAACGGTEPAADFVGDWTLAAVNSDPLQAQAPPGLVVHSGMLTFRENDTFRRVESVSFTAAGSQFTIEHEGTYTTDGNRATLATSSHVIDTGERSGNTFTLRVVGTSYRYQR